MSTKTSVLDHGYVELVETYGSDEAIIEAARMSTGKGFQGWGGYCNPCRNTGRTGCDRDGNECQSSSCQVCATCHGNPPTEGDEKLLRYLWKNKHASPFEMAGAVFEIKAPILVFREWHRHRSQSFNEMSGRYTPLPAEDYMPSVERLMMGSDGKNKQAGTIPGAGVLTLAGAEWYRAFLRAQYEAAERGYQEALKSGVPKELARIHLPVARYSRMRASANLRNWLAFATLRSTKKNPAAQWEIRQYADVVCTMLTEKFPRTMALFAEKSA